MYYECVWIESCKGLCSLQVFLSNLSWNANSFAATECDTPKSEEMSLEETWDGIQGLVSQEKTKIKSMCGWVGGFFL